MLLNDKKQKLKAYLQSLGSLAVAYSGGVDSSFLLKSAQEALGDKVIAVTARSATYPERELEEAEKFCKRFGIRHEVIVSEELDIEGFKNNPLNRCYLCKHELFEKIRQVARRESIAYIAEGSNCDDLSDYRPGLRAAKDMGILSPLRYAELTKQDIRELSKDMGLETWNKPSFACLSSRIPYGEEITRDKLQMIDRAERFLMDLGFRQVRVRHHGDIARIEIAKTELPRVFEENLADQINGRLREIGFLYVTLDLNGYRTGSMNAVLDQETLNGAKMK